MAEPSGMPRVDPAGPVAVHGGVSLSDVRAAIGPGAWAVPLGSEPLASLVITDDPVVAAASACERLPTVLVIPRGQAGPAGAFTAVADDGLASWLGAFADGEFTGGSSAGLESWLEGIRVEEMRNQEAARRIDREAEAASRRQMDELAAHIAAIEASRSWRVARRLVAAREAVGRLLHPRRSGPR